jgi:hypothetical protein
VDLRGAGSVDPAHDGFAVEVSGNNKDTDGRSRSSSSNSSNNRSSSNNSVLYYPHVRGFDPAVTHEFTVEFSNDCETDVEVIARVQSCAGTDVTVGSCTCSPTGSASVFRRSRCTLPASARSGEGPASACGGQDTADRSDNRGQGEGKADVNLMLTVRTGPQCRAIRIDRFYITA